VDRNRHKRICLDKAEAAGMATARLPIGDGLRLRTSKVLCTNHVVDILLAWGELGDWNAALDRVVPVRKRKADEGEEALEKGAHVKGDAEVLLEGGGDGEAGKMGLG
jgi:tRNA (guanine9-N1)-methyltransferase